VTLCHKYPWVQKSLLFRIRVFFLERMVLELPCQLKPPFPPRPKGSWCFFIHVLSLSGACKMGGRQGHWESHQYIQLGYTCSRRWWSSAFWNRKLIDYRGRKYLCNVMQYQRLSPVSYHAGSHDSLQLMRTSTSSTLSSCACVRRPPLVAELLGDRMIISLVLFASVRAREDPVLSLSPPSPGRIMRESGAKNCWD
jgi:hypothetical protein